MKKIIIWVVVIVLVVIGLYFLFGRGSSGPVDNTPLPAPSSTNGQSTSTSGGVMAEKTTIGKSVQGRDIVAYHYGTGTKELLFIGDIHGGYEWNTALVAYQLADYLKAHPEAIPKSVSVTVIPVMNPDGLNKVVDATTRFTASYVSQSSAARIAGRYNANK